MPFPFVISSSTGCASYLDLFPSWQGYGDTGPEGEEGQVFGGRPAPGQCFRVATGGAEQPGQQPLAQPQRKFITLLLLDMW